VLLESLTMSADEFARGTGWEIKPEGACRDDICVPLDSSTGDTVDVTAVAGRLGMPVVADAAHGVWALGPASSPTGRALLSANAPELTLPDLRTGEEFSLSSLRGNKVLLLAWASW
jgi:hypothetical protein